MQKNLLLVVALILGILLVACSPSITPTPQITIEATEEMVESYIVVSDIDPDDPVGKIEDFLPLADYLATNLIDFGITAGDVRIATSTDEMSEWLRTGEVHLYYDSLFPALVAADASGAIPILRRWRDGSPSYRSLFFTLSDSGVSNLEDLRGKVIAYDDNSSTSGYLLPTAHLIENGFTVQEVASIDASVNADTVGYFFTGDDDNTIELVLSGQVAAGVIDNLTYADEIPEETREGLVILAETEDVPRQVVLISPTVSEEMREGLITAMVNLTESEEGLAILDTLNTDRFDEFPGGAEAALESFRPYYDIVLGADEE